VDNVTGCDAIADHFASKYDELYSSVAYDVQDMDDLKRNVDNQLAQMQGRNNVCIIITSDVDTAVSSLKHGKRDGFYGLTSDHVLHAGQDLHTYIALLFSSLVTHGAVTDDLAFSTIIPIPKGTSSRTVSANYQAITFSSILCKLFDRILVNCYADLLATSQLQFGFKKTFYCYVFISFEGNH